MCKKVMDTFTGHALVPKSSLSLTCDQCQHSAVGNACSGDEAIGLPPQRGATGAEERLQVAVCDAAHAIQP